MLAVFPIPDSARINAQFLCQFLLGEPSCPAPRGESFAKRGGWGRRIVPEKGDDRRHVTDWRSGCVALPVRDGQRTDSDLLGYFPLQQSEVDPSGTEVVA